MTAGVITELNELIALKRLVRQKRVNATAKALKSGTHFSAIRGRGMDFAEARNYQAGDEIRHMEWRVTARTGRPHIKIYQEEKERPVVLVLDFNPSMYFGTRYAFKSVIAARLAALIAWTTVEQGDKIGGILSSPIEHNEFKPKARNAGILPLLAALNYYTKLYQQLKSQVNSISLSEILNKLHYVVRPGSLIVLISDFYELNRECESKLRHLKTNNDLIAYRICDFLELSPPPAALYAITDGSEELLLDTRLPRMRDNYLSWCNKKQESISNSLKKLQIPFSQVTAETDLAQLINETFPRRPRG